MLILNPLHSIRARAVHELRYIEETLNNGKSKNCSYENELQYYRGYWKGKISAITELLSDENEFNEVKFSYDFTE